MVQRGDGVDLAREAVAELLRGNLGGDMASDPWIAREVYSPHPSRADERENFVRSFAS